MLRWLDKLAVVNAKFSSEFGCTSYVARGGTKPSMHSMKHSVGDREVEERIGTSLCVHFTEVREPSKRDRDSLITRNLRRNCNKSLRLIHFIKSILLSAIRSRTYQSFLRAASYLLEADGTEKTRVRRG